VTIVTTFTISLVYKSSVSHVYRYVNTKLIFHHLQNFRVPSGENYFD